MTSRSTAHDSGLRRAAHSYHIEDFHLQTTTGLSRRSACRGLVLYRQKHSWLCSYLHQRLGNNPDAQDITQHIFLRLCEQPEQLNNIRDHRAYLVAAANRLCIDFWRHDKIVRTKLTFLKNDDKPTEPSAEQHAASQQNLAKIHSTLRNLPAPKAAVFIDLRIHHLTGKEAAKRHNISLSTVRNYLIQTTELLLAIHY